MPYTARCVVLALALTGCGTTGDGRTVLTVLASPSLMRAFAEVGAAYHSADRSVTVRLEPSPSTELTDQLQERRHADVLATTGMSGVARYVTHRRVFAHDSMTIAVPTGNPRRIRGLADLADPRLRVVVGGPDVPVGRYARKVLARAGVRVRPRAEETDADAVLSLVRTRVADAGIVYLADARSAGVAATRVPIPFAQNVTVTYLAAAVRGSGHGKAANAFVDWLASPGAGMLMRKYGFT
jgi:molybdate transport system substrate-binding protein